MCGINVYWSQLCVRCLLIVFLLSVACTGCGNKKMNFVYEIPKTNLCENSPYGQKPKLIDSKGDNYFVWSYKGKLYVLSSKLSSNSFKKNHPMLNVVVKEGIGPTGETVIFEKDPEKPDQLQNLERKFKEPKLMRYQDNDYFAYKIGNYIYLFGDLLTHEKFLKFREYPPDRDALYNAGPLGENIIYQVKEKKPDFSKFLLERHFEAPQLVSQVCDNFIVWKYMQKYYVLGTPKTSLRFETYHEIPHSKAFINFGPEGETVIFEDVPGNPSFLNHLRNKFQSQFLTGRV